MTPSSPLTAIIRELEQHPDAQRIKKLLIYTAVNRWESDPQLLQRLSLERIIKKNLDQFPSFNALKQAFNNSVSTLSRPATYGRLAQDILAQLNCLYGDEDPSTEVLTPASDPKLPQNSTDLRLSRAVQTLEEHRENIRIKKLLYALCFQRWENSFQVLETQTLTALLQQIVTNYPTQARFETVLHKLVSLLNRPQTYSQLAAVILGAIAPLYPAKDAATGLTRPMDEQHHEHPPEQKPMPRSIPPAAAIDHKQTMAFNLDELPLPMPAVIDHRQTMAFNLNELPIPRPRQGNNPEPNYKQTMALGGEAAQMMVIDTAPPLPQKTANPTAEKKHFAADLNIYELKLEVMKYANPLRTKILLFSIVHHPFDLSGKDWSMLRTCDFDELLFEVLQAASSLKALEIKLSAIARSLFDANEHLQAAEAIMQAINILSSPPTPNL
ncbi:hypothetical protein [Picosynechococcus sp. NKBG15041c]|uniref:hypothetical protein n=1 Tax=Picosynechococcus sp. NKBG15041c TaxID=1407650 RepID=UPI000407AA00|nr:hypothetical protein [Picosynechococcus sp. NKBG15041c]